jgi:hypothetical protein
MLIDFFEILGLYLLIVIALAGVVKIVFSFSKRHLQFAVTLKHLAVAAAVSNIVSYLVYKTFVTSGFWWGDLPKVILSDC